MGDKVLLRWQESIPICGISREVNLLGNPKGRCSFLIHSPDVIVLNGEEDEAMGICLVEWFRSKAAFGLGGLVFQYFASWW